VVPLLSLSQNKSCKKWLTIERAGFSGSLRFRRSATFGSFFLRVLAHLVIYDSGRACLLHGERVTACARATRILISCSRFRVSNSGFGYQGIGARRRRACATETKRQGEWIFISCSRFRVSVFGSRVPGANSSMTARVRESDQDFGFHDSDFRFQVSGFGFRVSNFESQVWGSGSGFRVSSVEFQC
jgi:hypothetical protein